MWLTAKLTSIKLARTSVISNNARLCKHSTRRVCYCANRSGYLIWMSKYPDGKGELFQFSCLTVARCSLPLCFPLNVCEPAFHRSNRPRLILLGRRFKVLSCHWSVLSVAGNCRILLWPFLIGQGKMLYTLLWESPEFKHDILKWYYITSDPDVSTWLSCVDFSVFGAFWTMKML